MLCLYETPAGFALFKVVDESRLKDQENLWQQFETPEQAADIVKLHAFKKFDNTQDAVAAATDLVRSCCRALHHMVHAMF